MIRRIGVQNRWFFPLTGLLFIVLLAIGGGTLVYTRKKWQKQTILTHCISAHIPGSKGHYHAGFDIIQDNFQVPIPARIGIIGSCIHPLHTHDTSGVIHIDYPTPVFFTLGDLFDEMGEIFTDTQVGALKASDGYTFGLMVNNKKIEKDYRFVTIPKEGHMVLTITSPQVLRK